MIGFYMHYVYKVVFIVVLIVVGIFGYRYYQNYNLSPYAEVDASRDLLQEQFTKANTLANEGKITEAVDAYNAILEESTSAHSNNVYFKELALLGKASLLRDIDFEQSVYATLALATGEQFNPEARASALEEIAKLYIYESLSQTNMQVLQDTIAGDMMFAGKVSKEQPYKGLLEYGDTLAQRPFTTAVLASMYAQEKNTQKAEEYLSRVVEALPSIPDTSPSKPASYAFSASAGLYLESHQQTSSVNPVELLATAVQLATAEVTLFISDEAKRQKPAVEETEVTQALEGSDSASDASTRVETEYSPQYNEYYAPEAQFQVVLATLAQLEPKAKKETVDAIVAQLQTYQKNAKGWVPSRAFTNVLKQVDTVYGTQLSAVEEVTE